MALWIIHLLKCHTSISAISAMLSVHWSTIQKIQKHIMDKALAAFETCLKKSNYRPRYLAVDEFAIHKGHRYATCVMDLETGFILWAGLGRSMADFEHFFKSIGLSLLSRLKAVVPSKPTNRFTDNPSLSVVLMAFPVLSNKRKTSPAWPRGETMRQQRIVRPHAA